MDELNKSFAGLWVRATPATGEPVEAQIDRTSDAPKRQVPDIPSLLPVSTRPITAMGKGSGVQTSYRVLTDQIMDSSGNQIRLTIALPLTEVDATTSRIVSLELLVGALVLLLGALSEWVVTRIGLRPLRDMETAADEIGHAGYPSRRRIAHPPERTELGRLGARLNAMLDAIDRAFEEKSAADARLRRFVSDASHELRTPLTSIRGYAQLYERVAPDLEVAESSLARIRTESERMSSLVEDLMTLARLDEDPALEPESFDLTELVATTIADVRAVDHSRTWTLSADGSAVRVCADRRRIAQVVLNLLTNARTHTSTASPVDVRVWSDSAMAKVAVIDHGAGIDADKRDKVFDRFYRTEQSRVRSSGGAGLGLAIVASIVHAHHGSVIVTETVGGGATFTVSLPLDGLRAP